MKTTFTSLVLVGLLTVTMQVHAMSIVSASPTPYSTGDLQQNDTDNYAIMTYIFNFNLGIELLYKNSRKTESEANVLQHGYATLFKVVESAASTAYMEGNSIDNPQYLVVKDGNHAPWWYTFNAIDTWDGTGDMALSDIWTGNAGDVSYMALYGKGSKSPLPVPEPSTLMLLGGGIFELAIYCKRRLHKES